MKITGRIEKIANITSIVIESRAAAGTINLYNQENFTDGEEVCLEVHTGPLNPPAARLQKLHSPLFQPVYESPITK